MISMSPGTKYEPGHKSQKSLKMLHSLPYKMNILVWNKICYFNYFSFPSLKMFQVFNNNSIENLGKL